MQKIFSNLNWQKLGLYSSFPLVISLFIHLFFAHYSNLRSKNSLIIYVSSLLMLLTLQYIIRHSLWTWRILGHGLVAIIWVISFVLFHHYGNHESYPFTIVMGNFLFALGIFSLLTYLSAKFKRIPGLIALLDMLCLIIPLAELGYFLRFGKGLSMDSLFALYQTNLSEAWEFLQAEISLATWAILIIGIFLALYFFYKTSYALSQIIQPTKSPWQYLGLILFLIVTLVFFVKTNLIYNLYKINDYAQQLQNYHQYQTDVKNDLKVNLASSTITKTPGTIILIIGESASKDQMRAFNPAVPVDNTPWETAMTNNPDFHFFAHAYTSWPQTVPSLQRALTQENQYGGPDFLHAANILNIANALGYHTYWFSNQQMVGQYDTTTTLVAKTAHTTGFTNHGLTKETKYDGDLLPFLKSVPKDQNNFIILHFMGSHLGYNARYPHDQRIFNNIPNADYYNTLHYSDKILQEIYSYGKANLNLQLMIYFSDHAEDMALNHNPDTFTWAMARIPLWIYTSPSYAKAYPNTFKTLQEHKNKYFTNDLLYDLVIGLMHASGNQYIPTNDLSNPAYKYNATNLTTMLGQDKLNQDPYYNSQMPVNK